MNDMEISPEFHEISPELIEAVLIMEEIDVMNIVDLLSEDQAATFEHFLMLRRKVRIREEYEH